MKLTPGDKFDFGLLKSPPADCEVSYSWLWNVPITRAGIDKGLTEIKRAGINSIYILPMPKDFRPELTRTFLEPEYLSEEFWELVNYALREAVKLGITPWLYDEGGWPSGSACGRTLKEYPDARATLLGTKEIALKKGERYTPCRDFVALFNKKERLSEDFVAECDLILTEYSLIETPYPAFTDYTDPKVTETFIGNTYAGYKDAVGDLFGSIIPLIFTDEPGLKPYTMAKGIFDKFFDRYGYDLRDYIYVIPDGGAFAESEKERLARIDWCELTGELFVANTFQKLSDYCESCGIAYAGHLMADNYPDSIRCGYFSQLDILRRFHIPGVDAIWEQIRYPYGGRAPVDPQETERMPFFPRLASSAARQSGRNICLTEAMGIYGDGITPDEIRYVTNYHVIRGINYISYAHIPFGKSRYSALATRPDFRPEKPGFYNLGHINEYFARLSYLARLGCAEGDTALYHPCRDYAASQETSSEAVESYRKAGVYLEGKNIAFDIIDDYGIRAAAVTSEGIRLGDAVYKHVVVPKCRFMPEDVKEKIAPFLGEGKPTYEFKNKKLRVMTRKLDTGRLWFIFNEGIDTAAETVDIADGKKLYRIDIQSGDMYRESVASFSLVCGDMAVYLVTDETYDTVSPEVESTVQTDTPVAVEYKRLVIDFNGLKNEYGEGEPNLSECFSGEITYKVRYALKEAPRDGERYRIRLEGFSLTARVKVGECEHTLGMTPMCFTIMGEDLMQFGEMTVTVANTSLDEIHRAEHLKRFYPEAELGPYLSRIEEFEKNPPALLVGKVYIDKLV
ncbi:MAG: hypothetical protein IJ459_00675 [Clostridia bacterium]|nr:hypothetical protein [Clostridia bacterium]